MGQRSYAVSPDGSMVAFTRNESGFGRLCVVDVASREVARSGAVCTANWGGVVSHLTALRTGARTPTQIVSYRTDTWERTIARHRTGRRLGSSRATGTRIGRGRTRRRRVARPPLRRRAGTHAVLDPWRADRPMAGRVHAPTGVLVVARVGHPGPRSAWLDGPRPGLPAGTSRWLGTPRRGRYGSDPAAFAQRRPERVRVPP